MHEQRWGSNRAPRARAGGRRTRYAIAWASAQLAGTLTASTALATTRGEPRMVSHHASPGVRIVHAAVARAAGVNAVVPAFKIRFGYLVRGSRLELTKFTLFPFYRRFEALPSGGCLRCAGTGHFSDPRIEGHVLSETIQAGRRYMTPKTIFVESVTSPDEIGRFKVYGLDVNAATPHPILRSAGCTPANLAPTNDHVFDWKHLPQVPCAGRTPSGDRISITTPIELSSTVQLAGTITGHASEREWLIAFESQNDRSCAPNALAEELRTQVFLKPIRVRGTFAFHFKTATATTSGFQCAYLQTGGLLTVSSDVRVPDGRVSATSSFHFLAGDSLSMSSPPTAPPGSTPVITVSGHASVDEELYVFAPYSPCATTAQAEFAVDPQAFETPVNQGGFSQRVQINTPQSPPPGVTVVYECAYLQLFAPPGKNPVGPTLAFAPSYLTLS